MSFETRLVYIVNSINSFGERSVLFLRQFPYAVSMSQVRKLQKSIQGQCIQISRDKFFNDKKKNNSNSVTF